MGGIPAARLDMDDLKTIEDARQHDVRRAATGRPKSALWRRLAWLAIVVLIAAGVTWWIRAQPGPPASLGRSATSGATPVASATAQSGDVNVTLDALGTVTPLATVTVRTQISGQLMKVLYQEGQTVKQGDLIAEIDSRPYELALGQAQGQLLRDQALLKNAELDLARYRKLVAQDSIPKQQYDTQEALVAQYQGTVRTDQAQVDNAKLNIAYCHIVAPISGRVGLRQVDQGNYVQTNDTNGIVVITQIQPITVLFTLPEDNLPAIMKRLRAGVSLPVTAWDRAHTVQLAAGQLITVDNQIDTSTGTVKLRAQFDNTDLALFPNQFVNAELTVDVLRNTTVAPAAAIQRGAPGTFVYLIKPDDTVAVQPVKLGPSEGEHVAVLSGLNPGDRVVVDGADKLRDGAKVSLRDASGAAATGGTTQPQPADQPRDQRRRGTAP